MQEWINSVLASPGLSLMMLPALLLLGILSMVGSVCNIAVVGALTGYAGAKEIRKHRDTVLVAVSLMLGVTLALAAIGALIGYAGQVFTESFGRYGRALAGMVAMFFGLMALNLVPLIRLPRYDRPTRKYPQGTLAAIIFGFALGGVSLTSSISCCSPALLIVLGVISLQGAGAKSALLMGMFAVGYSLPLVAILLGISYGKWALRTSKAMPVIRVIAGILLLVVGFYLLATI